MPKISVIIGIYNCAPYLQEALDSLYAQTFQDFEIILCNDGSTDETFSIAERNKRGHSNIILLNNDHNCGLNQTLNNCLSVARGQYIARMDGDDISFPTRFEVESKFLDENPDIAIVSVPMVHFDSNGVYGRGRGGNYPGPKDFLGKTPITHAPCMVRREAYMSVGGYTVDKRLLRVEDYHLWIKMYKSGYRAYMLPECLYAMRDDRFASKRRKSLLNMRNCMYAQYLACKAFNMPFYAYLYMLKPVVSFFMPYFVYEFFHKRLMNK